MYNIEELKREKASCRRKIVTFSVLTGVAAVLIILSCIIYGVVLALVLSDPNLDESMFANVSLGATFALIFVVVTLAIAMCAFIPFIVINGIKHGKRRRLLNKIENDNGVING